VDIRLVRTDIAGFFGFTERGPVVDPTVTDPKKQLQYAVKVTSWNDFRNKFGGYLINGYLAYAVRGFFATGGTTCYVVRAGAAKTPATTALLPLPAAGAPTLITYVSAAAKAGQSKLQLDTVDVVSPGDVIALGDPLTGECVSVGKLVSDQCVTVAPPLAASYEAGVAVYRINGSALKPGVAAGETNLPVIAPGIFQDGDLISIQGGGVSEVRVVSGSPSATSIHIGLGLDFPYNAGAAVRILPAALTATAQGAGSWGNRIQLEITPLEPGNAVTHFALRVTVDQGDDPLQPAQEEFYPLLSLDPNDPSPTPIYAPTVVNDASQIIYLNAPPQTPNSPVPQLLVNVGPLANGSAYLQGGADGVEADTVTTQDFQAALDILGMVDEVAVLCCPDAVGPPPPRPTNPPAPTAVKTGPCNGQAAATTTSPLSFAKKMDVVTAGWSTTAIQQAMIAQCVQLQYRVAVLDTPMSPQTGTMASNLTSLQPAQAKAWLAGLGVPAASKKFAAVYYPWIKVPDELSVQGPNRVVPPSGHIAGAYAYTDNQFGVQKPPANVELQFIADVDLAVTDVQQGFLNPAGINAIRPIPGRGIRVWGARSISQDDDSDWKYIHIRRLMSMIEDSVEKASQWVVFQPNDFNLRRMLTHSLNTFLQSIWLTGGLQGTVATDGYFVKCDSTNNPQASIDAGILVCQVGVAIASPMEFLVFELRRSVAGSQVVEA
jgi:hypothetical protein